MAERDYGKEVINRYRRSGSLVREEPPEYGTDKSNNQTDASRVLRDGGFRSGYLECSLPESPASDALPPLMRVTAKC